MSAVKPARLNEQIDEIIDQIADPVALRRKCADVLDLYADRTRRPNRLETADEIARSLRVPKPVIRAIGVALRRCAQEQPEHARPASAALWEASYREMRLLACAILSGQANADVPKWAVDYVVNCDDEDVIVEMARLGLESWRERDVPRFLDEVETWLHDSKRRLRTFALIALDAAVEDHQFKDIPSVYRLIAGLTATAKLEEKRALRRLIETLVGRSPPEAARFLMDEIAGVGKAAQDMTHSILDSFPPRQRELLENTLSSK
ncbi:MAG: DNA alkylation repair protein [Anaerolineales bacterium]